MVTTAMNKVLISIYKREAHLSPDLKLYTYGAWVSQGYRPRKGEPAKHNCKLWTRKGLVNCWLWSEKQVDKDENVSRET